MLPSSFVSYVLDLPMFLVRASSSATGLLFPASPPLLNNAAPYVDKVLSSEQRKYSAYVDSSPSRKIVISFFISQRIDVILKGTEHPGDDSTERVDEV